MTAASTTTVLTALIALAVLLAVVAAIPLMRRRRSEEAASAAGAAAEDVPPAPNEAAGDGAATAPAAPAHADPPPTGGEAPEEADTTAPAADAADDPPLTADPGAVVADLHARAVVLREQVGWPSGEALAGMPVFRETVEAVLAKDLPDDALLRIGADNDEFVASVGLAALVERDALPDDWTDTAVRRLRRSGTQDEHFLLLTLVGAPGRVIGRVLEQNRHISDAGIAWFLEQRVAAGEPVDAETFSADVRLDPEVRTRLLEGLVRHTCVLEQREGVRERFSRDPALGLVRAQAPDPVVLLGDVGELEEECERPQHGRLAFEPESGDLGAQRLPRAAGSPGIAGERPDPLLGVEQVLPLLLDEDAPEEISEQADVGPERAVCGHAVSLNAAVGGARRLGGCGRRISHPKRGGAPSSSSARESAASRPPSPATRWASGRSCSRRAPSSAERARRQGVRSGWAPTTSCGASGSMTRSRTRCATSPR